MGLIPDHSEGQTPVDASEMKGLRIKTITTQAELNDFEQLNIDQAAIWVMKNRFKPDDILTENFKKSASENVF